MLKFHNGSANLANLVLFFSRKDAKFANFSAYLANLHVFFFFLLWLLAVGYWQISNCVSRKLKANS